MKSHISTTHRVQAVGHDELFPHAPSPGRIRRCAAAHLAKQTQFSPANPMDEIHDSPDFAAASPKRTPPFANDMEAVSGGAAMFAKRTLLVFFNEISVRPSRLVSRRSRRQRPTHSLFGRKPSLLRSGLSLFRPAREAARNALALLHELTSAGIKMVVKMQLSLLFSLFSGKAPISVRDFARRLFLRRLLLRDQGLDVAYHLPGRRPRLGADRPR